jgi:hypothetical protein
LFKSRSVAGLLVAAIAVGCEASSQATSSSLPSIQTSAISAAELADAIKFRREVGLRADEAFVRSVYESPFAVEAYGIRMFPQEVAELDRRASVSDEIIAIVKAYGATVPDNYAGVYVDPTTGIVYGMFVGDLAAPIDTIRPQIRPDAPFVAQPARNTIVELDALLARADRAWFASIGAPLRGGSVSIKDNVVLIYIDLAPPSGLGVIYRHFGVDDSILSIVIDPLST